MTGHARELRKMALHMSYTGGDGNLQSAFSSADIISSLYNSVIDVKRNDVNRNIFILSKGQANIVLLAELAYQGLFDPHELQTFCKIDSRISMQADRTKLKGIEVSAGSLGHGFPVAVGMAWAKKIKNENGTVYVLAGDGEMNEGTMWESVLFAASEKLNNLILIIDNNHSIERLINMGGFEVKMKAFGFEYIKVNGHDECELIKTYAKLCDKPLVIDANTVRGYGCQSMMDDNSWFHRAPDKNELSQMIYEVDMFGMVS